MITQRSAAELLDYERRLIINSTNVNVEFYALVDGVYTLQEQTPIYLRLLEPGAAQLYRMDITNLESVDARVKAMFVNITGDINELGPYLVFGGSTPYSFSDSLDNLIQYNVNTSRYFIDLIDEIRIPGNEMLSVYVYIQMSELAENDVADMNIEIENIMFIDV